MTSRLKFILSFIFIKLLFCSYLCANGDVIFIPNIIADSISFEPISVDEITFAQGDSVPYDVNTFSAYLPDSAYLEATSSSSMNDTPDKKHWFVKNLNFIIPSALIIYGTLARFDGAVKKLDESTSGEVEENTIRPLWMDDYLQYTPTVAVYAAELFGLKPKHNLKDRTIVMATSFLLMTATVQTIKCSTHIMRPDDSERNSFPSGHTATAFVGAQVLAREYGKNNPWLAVAGYTSASITGAFRILNNRHWFSDVVAGAGIGILSVEVAYLFLPKISGWISPKSKPSDSKLVVVPAVSAQSKGLAMLWMF